MKKKKIKLQLSEEKIHYNNLRRAHMRLVEENESLKKELESLKSMNLTEFYKTIERDNRKSLWFERIDALTKDVINLTNELKQ